MAPKKEAKKDAPQKDAPKKDAPKTAGPNIRSMLASKIVWIILGIIGLVNIACIGFNIAMILKYKRETREDPSADLRNKMVTAINHAPIATMHVSRLAYEVAKVPNRIKAVDQAFAHLRTDYQEFVDKKYFRRKSLNGWKLHERSLYYIAKGKKTWHSAEDFCVSRDSHLASILSDEEQNFITSQLNHSAWIGLTDEQEEGSWVWTDNSRFTTQYWSEGKPSNSEHKQGTEQDCASIIPSATGKNWNDADCYELNGWVCKDSLVYEV